MLTQIIHKRRRLHLLATVGGVGLDLDLYIIEQVFSLRHMLHSAARPEQTGNQGYKRILHLHGVPSGFRPARERR